MSETKLVYIGDHAERAAADVITPLKRKPRFRAFLDALMVGVQRLEDECFDLIVGRALDVAYGDALEQWGALVGEPRLGLGDDAYRRFLLARIRVNRSRGTVDDLVAIYKLVMDTEQVEYYAHYPAGFRLHAWRQTYLSDAEVRRVLRTMEQAKPAGVGMVLSESLADPLLLQDVEQSLDGPKMARTLV